MSPVQLQSIFPKPDYDVLARRLTPPSGMVDVILDTDTYNEIDDQYALAYMMASTERLRVRAITAAPFYREPAPGKVIRSSSPEDGMEKSYEEILRVLSFMGRTDMHAHVYRGSAHYLSSETEPVPSEAVNQIIAISREYTAEAPLYVVAIGAVTNVASALLTDPTLRDRIVLVWLGGHSYHWHDTNEFNMMQDVAAARVIFASGVPLVQFPCMGVVSEFRFSRPELEYWFRDKNDLCNYLIDSTYEFAKVKFPYPDWSKPLWDVTTIAWLVNSEMTLSRLVPAPIPQYDNTYAFQPDRHPIRCIYYVKKDEIIADVAKKLASI